MPPSADNLAGPDDDQRYGRRRGQGGFDAAEAEHATVWRVMGRSAGGGRRRVAGRTAVAAADRVCRDDTNEGSEQYGRYNSEHVLSICELFFRRREGRRHWCFNDCRLECTVSLGGTTPSVLTARLQDFF